jgi:mannitol/fructose-specific phosphotransferase system IIA component
MLYTGAYRDDVDREKTLTLKQIQQVKLSQTQIKKLIMEIKENNKEKLANIKRYLYLVKEAKEHASLSEWQN